MYILRVVVVLLLTSRATAYQLCGALGGATSPRRHPGVAAAVQVVTDIDDTIKSSGGVALAGIPLGGVDTSYTRSTVYPGVFHFGAELASHSLGLGRRPADVAVLTARAEEFRFALEIKQSDKICVGFRRAGEARGLPDGWGIGPVLYGSVQEWICQCAPPSTPSTRSLRVPRPHRAAPRLALTRSARGALPPSAPQGAQGVAQG